MKHLRPFLFLLILLLPVVVLWARQDTPAPRLEVTGVNASRMPSVTVTANVYDNLGQPLRGLTAADFALTGDLVGLAQIVSVENISDDNLPFAVVLMIDTSTSMIGTPIERAREAAHAFIDNIGPNDPVAIMTFDTQVLVAQDYTTDKAALSAVIDSLQAGGTTALYQGAYDAVLRAADSPTPRRAVILLGDGAEYGGQSQVEREAAVSEALVRGVPVYTIGLGFGADRTYLQQLSSSTNARSYESPTPDQLTQIYTDLATLLRSQYVITLDAPLPLDGTQYNLRLQATTPEGTAEATAVLRAPIPVPIVRLPGFDVPLTEPTDILATILADDPLASVTFQVDDREPLTAESPYVLTIDPVDYLPGDYILTATATDDDGDQGSDVISITVAALPSQISLSPDLASLGAIAQPQTITVQSSGQTPAAAASVAFNEGETPLELSAPFSFTIDPLQFPPGDNAVTVSVTNEGGATAEQTFDFTVAALPPQITIVGVQDGQSIDAPVTFGVEIVAQEDIAQVNASVNEVVIEPNEDGTYTLDPILFAPGANTLTVNATTVGGRSGTARLNVIVAALPPRITVNGLTPGDTLRADRDLTFDFVTQSPVVHVAVFVDAVDLAHLVRAPYGITLRILDFAPGEHTLRIVAENADAQSSTLDVPFSIAPEPAITATADAVNATQSALATATQQALSTADAVQATQVAQVTLAAQATRTIEQATQIARAEATQIALAATTTRAVVNAIATENAQATQSAQASATQSIVNATATQVKVEATATQAAQVALDATATQVKVEATATQAAQLTQSALASATSAQATQVVALALNVQATATDAARATELANALATLAAQMSATAQVRQTAQATATQGALDATATQIARSVQATATDIARATQLANDLATLGAQMTATRSVQATTTQQSLLAATGNALATQQVITEATGTIVAQATANAVSTQEQISQQTTQAAQATQSLLDATSTQAVANTNATQNAQATAELAATATESARATVTQIAQATQAAQATRRSVIAAQAQAATRGALATSNAQARLVAQATQNARATRNAIATATAVQATQNVVDATATQTALEAQNAAATLAAQQTLAALEASATQFVVNATATRHNLETRTAFSATTTRTALDITATVDAEQTTVAEATRNAVATAEQQRANQATATAQANATLRANVIATDAQATQVAQAEAATATSDSQATLDTRRTAVGPTVTPLGGGEQGAPTVTPQASPTLTEIQAQEPPASSNVAPILIVLIVIVVIIIVLVLVMRGRGSPPR